MPTHVKFFSAVRLVLSLWLSLLCHLVHAQTQGSRSLADEMESSNTATGRMLELVKAAKAQEQAAKGFGQASLLTAVNPVTPRVIAPGPGSTQIKPPEKSAPAETPTLWYLAGVGERLVAELIYQQRVYKLTASDVPQLAGPWKLLSLSPQGLSLSHPNGQLLELQAPAPGQAAPQLAAATPVPATPAVAPMAVPAVVPAAAPGSSPLANMFPLPK